MKMNYCVLGTNDMQRSIRFYDALFASQGLSHIAPTQRMSYWLGEGFAFAVALPIDGQPACVGNGSMVGFALDTQAEVDRLHQLALDLGARCEGTPGQRGPRYSAYLRDPDGNKLCLSD